LLLLLLAMNNKVRTIPEAKQKTFLVHWRGCWWCRPSPQVCTSNVLAAADADRSVSSSDGERRWLRSFIFIVIAFVFFSPSLSLSLFLSLFLSVCFPSLEDLLREFSSFRFGCSRKRRKRVRQRRIQPNEKGVRHHLARGFVYVTTINIYPDMGETGKKIFWHPFWTPSSWRLEIFAFLPRWETELLLEEWTVFRIIVPDIIIPLTNWKTRTSSR